MAFEIKKASRQNIIPLIGMYAESGCGKTFSSLLLARGIVGPSGRIVLVDTETGRGEMFADEIPGGYETIQFAPPFAPRRAIEVIDYVEKSGADIGIMDSLSHFWEGLGGVLDAATTNEEKSGKPGLHNWKTPKMDHAQMVLRLQQSKIPWIICMRAKHKTRQVREPGKRAEIVKDDHTSPIQAEDFIFELTAHLEINPDHTIHLTKKGTEALAECFPRNGKEPLTVAHGEAIARWSKGGNAAPNGKPADQTVSLKLELWNETKSEHQGNRDAFEKFLRASKLITDEEAPGALPAERLNQILCVIRDRKAAAQ